MECGFGGCRQRSNLTKIKSMRYTKYYPNHGYVTVVDGGGLVDTIKTIFGKIPFGKVAGLAKHIPPELTQAAKDSAIKVATSGITAAGDRVGSAIAEKIAPKPQSAAKADAATRKEVLKELKLYDDKPKASSKAANMDAVYGFGNKPRKRKQKGSGIKVLI